MIKILAVYIALLIAVSPIIILCLIIDYIYKRTTKSKPQKKDYHIVKYNPQKNFAEEKVARKLQQLDSKSYILYNDILLRHSYGTSQIDHIIISRYGIFVIETKDYKGVIIGEHKAERWNEYIRRKKYSFQNPIRQNYGHIKALCENLELSEDKFISIIAFSDKAILEDNIPFEATYISQLPKHILLYNQVFFSDEQVEKIKNRMEYLIMNSNVSIEEHIANIKRKYQ